MVRILANNAPSKRGTSFARHIQDSCSCCWRDRRILCTSKYSPIRLAYALAGNTNFLDGTKKYLLKSTLYQRVLQERRENSSRLGRVQPCGQLRNFVYMECEQGCPNCGLPYTFYVTRERGKCFKTKQTITFLSMKLYIF
jgi:hypothetical protein